MSCPYDLGCREQIVGTSPVEAPIEIQVSIEGEIQAWFEGESL